MTIREILSRINADITAAGPVSAKSAAQATIGALAIAGLDPVKVTPFGSLNIMRQEIEDCDGTPESLEPIMRCIVKCGTVVRLEENKISEAYEANWVH